MPNNENSFTHDGVEYVAVGGVIILCDGCAFYEDRKEMCMIDALVDTPSCYRTFRKDGREVIFKKKVNLEME